MERSISERKSAFAAFGSGARKDALSALNYQEFLKKKKVLAVPKGKRVNEKINPGLWPFQKSVVEWAVKRGRAALFEDCGLGKSIQQLEWARIIGQRSLLLTPLAVAEQMQLEAEKFGIEARIVTQQSECRDGINITNYQKLHRFEPDFDALVLDESSILKSFDGKTRRQITQFAENIPYRLACTATPAPNDITEIVNHSEFLGVMSGREILALFFRQDGNSTHKWKLKGHAEEDFWKWLASWSVAIRRPSDIGFDDAGFDLPPLRFHDEIVGSGGYSSGKLFDDVGRMTIQERRRARRESMEDRVEKAAELVNASTEPWLVWCDLNAESAALKAAIPGCVEVKGSDSQDHKRDALLGFSSGKYRVLVTKPSIAGFGMNWQHCCKQVFVGLSDSYEQLYQATRRCWRYGQERPVDVYIVTSEAEGTVRENIEMKERKAKEMMDNVIEHTHRNLNSEELAEVDEYRTGEVTGDGWKMMLGDSVERIDEVESESVGLSVFSPPFPGMYAYTNSMRDMGNVRDMEQMIEQFRFLVTKDKLMRVLMPGRSVCVHLCQGVAFKGQDGHSGLKDFRGRIIDLMEEEGWIYYGEVCIEKDPQVKAIRTKDAGLLFRSLATDSARMHMALADYVLQFRKPGDNPKPIRAGISKKYDNEEGWITANEWIEWASPVWRKAGPDEPRGIRETDVLSYQSARSEKDEKHICPLQLGVIERCVKLWSAPGELVFSPFAGIGSEGYEAIRHNRQFIGCELKESYFQEACKNLRIAESKRAQGLLFSAGSM